MSFDAYAVLRVAPTASHDELKAAYKKMLLAHHPDKRAPPLPADTDTDTAAAFLDVQKAWGLVGTPAARAKYDAMATGGRSLSNTDHATRDEFVPTCTNGTETVLRKACRCGDFYEISEEDLAAGYNTVQCNGCSLYVTVDVDT
jgi:diphthamide biosynthesis protein 4